MNTSDTRGRPLKDLRLSVIDQCNFRCPYCMPKETFGTDYRFMTSAERLSFDELARMARVFVWLGVEKIRITVDGIAEAQRVGLAPVKVNTVIEHGVNDSQILPLVEHFRHTGVQLRFIEYMDVGGASQWRSSRVLSADAMRAVVEARYPLLPDGAPRGHDTAELWRHADGAGTVGFIASMSHPFCGECSRARVSADGQLYLCLFAQEGEDLRPYLGAGQEAALAARISSVWRARSDRYSEQRELHAPAPRTRKIVRMSLVGG